MMDEGRLLAKLIFLDNNWTCPARRFFTKKKWEKNFFFFTFDNDGAKVFILLSLAVWQVSWLRIRWKKQRPKVSCGIILLSSCFETIIFKSWNHKIIKDLLVWTIWAISYRNVYFLREMKPFLPWKKISSLKYVEK